MDFEVIKSTREKLQYIPDNDIKSGKGVVDESGAVRCAVCGEPLSKHSKIFDCEIRRPCACDRRENELRAQEQARRELECKSRSFVESSPLFDKNLLQYTFARDDSEGSKASKTCRKYVEKWGEMFQNNFGLILSGGPGTGKTFLAAATINKIREQYGVCGAALTTSQLLILMKRADSPNDVIKELNQCQIVLLDDYGAQRGTEYAAELIENFLDARMLSEKPLIITTNFSGRQLSDLSDMRAARSNDRIRQMCPLLVALAGESRRREMQQHRMRAMLDILQETY